MAVKTYAQQLEEVQAAITAVETGAQGYSMAGRSLTRANLQTLYDREKYLRAMVVREGAKGLDTKYVVVEPG